MSPRRSIIPIFSRLCCLIAVAGLTGCVTSERAVTAVTSSPTPAAGYAPIIAYDAYARAVYHEPTEESVLIARVIQRREAVTPTQPAPGPAEQTGSE
jgi:hypothetical protein